MTGESASFIRTRMSMVEVHNYHAQWWEQFDHDRYISAANAMSEKGLPRIRLLRIDSEGENG